MPKGILEFNLPEEDLEFVTAQKGLDYKLALEEFYNKSIRQRRKYDDALDGKQRELLEELFNEYIALTEGLLD